MSGEEKSANEEIRGLLEDMRSKMGTSIHLAGDVEDFCDRLESVVTGDGDETMSSLMNDNSKLEEKKSELEEQIAGFERRDSELEEKIRELQNEDTTSSILQLLIDTEPDATLREKLANLIDALKMGYIKQHDIMIRM